MDSNRYQTLLKLFCYSLFIVVFTFPYVATEIEPGLDPSYMWAFNHFFFSGLQFGKDVVFAYGPLGFIKNPMPIGHNLEIAIALIAFIRISFVFSLLLLCHVIRPGKDLFAFAVALIASSCFNGVDYAIMGTIAATVFIYHENRRITFLLLASFFTVLGLLIKINIGITGGLILGSYVLIDWLYYKRPKSLLITAGFCVLSLIISWGIIYHRLSGLFPFLRNIIIMSSGNLSATALNTPNNWWILGTCFILFASFPFIARNKRINLLYIISALAFFGIFKYSFAREEELHMVQLLYFMMFLSTFCIILFAELKPVHIIWLMVPLMLYNINMQLSNRYHLGDQVQIFGINNFRTLVLNFSATKQKSIENSEMNIRKSKLPDSFLNKIKDQTVDCYPWELSYIPANGLNYKPRPLIQLGCVNSTILDAENALFFESPEAPKFIIWHHAWCSDRLCSIDERYLLNEDALATYQLLNHYEIVDSSENILLLERTTRERLEKPSHVSSSNYQWNEWIPVTTVDPSSIVLAKPIFQKSFIGKLKSFLYKEKEYFIEYKLTDGQIFRHRFVPDDAISGVWMSPYLVNLSNGLGGTTVKEVRFIATDNMRMLVNKIELEWMVIRKK